MLFGNEFDSLFVVCFVLFFFFLQSDSSVCSDIRGLRKHHPFSYVVQLTWIDLWLIYSAAWHVSYPFTLSWFSRWNLVSCVYIEIISYARRFFSNRRGTAWYMYIREHNDQAPGYVVYSSPVTHACRGDMRARAHAKIKKIKKNMQIDSFCKFYSNIAYLVWGLFHVSSIWKTFAFLTFRWQKPIKIFVSILAF